jgi:hypothetical protein
VKVLDEDIILKEKPEGMRKIIKDWYERMTVNGIQVRIHTQRPSTVNGQPSTIN